MGYYTYHSSKVNFFFEDNYDENTNESLDNVISIYLNQDLKYQLCSEGCYSCILRNDGEHCVKCKNNLKYYERRDSISTCIIRESNPDAYYFDSNEKAFIKCSSYWYRKKEDNNVICYDECPSSMYIYTNSKECVDQCEKVSYQGECMDNCPSNNMIINSKNECKEEIAAEKGVDVISAPFSREEIINHIEIESFTEEGITILGNDYTVQVYPTSNQINESNAISSISLGNCEFILRRENGIPNDEPLLIYKIDIERENAITPKVEYKMFTIHKRELELSVCESEGIVVSSPIVNKNMMNYTFGEMMSAQYGFDVYDKADPFFNDKCVTFSNNSIDFPIKDRRNDYFVDVDLCDEGCSYDTISFQENKISCNCSSESENEKEEFVSLGSSLLQSTNIELFKCYKEALSIKKNIQSIGFYFIGCILILLIAFGISFSIYGFDDIYRKLNYVIEQFTLKETQMKLESDEYQITEKNNDDIDNCIYEIAKEKRNICKYFTFLFINQISLIKLVFFLGDYDIFIIELSNFLFSLASDFTMNALLFSDDVISQRYRKGKINPFTTIILTILSNVLGSILAVIPSRLSNFGPVLEMFSTEPKKEKIYIMKLRKIMKIIKYKIIIYYIFIFNMIVIYLYFLCSFCNVYRGSQWNWFKNGITSILMSFLSSFINCLVITLLRYIGLYCNSKSMYNIS